jgi:hypothetical protein
MPVERYALEESVPGARVHAEAGIRVDSHVLVDLGRAGVQNVELTVSVGIFEGRKTLLARVAELTVELRVQTGRSRNAQVEARSPVILLCLDGRAQQQCKPGADHQPS